MKSFLCKSKSPIIKWGLLPDNTFFEGEIPDGYKLAISPSKGYIILDVDVDLDKDKNGFRNLPINIGIELLQTYYYATKRGGAHFWIKYTGDIELANKASNQSIDLRTHKGYVIYYPANNGDDIRNHINEIKESSLELNKWLESLFGYV